MSLFLPLQQDVVDAAGADRDSFWAGGGSAEGKLGPWNTITLDGRVFPDADGYEDPRACAVRVSGEAIHYEIDKQKAHGKSGQRFGVGGYAPQPFVLEVRIWRPEQWAAYKAYISVIAPTTRDGKHKAHLIDHPFLSAHGINQVKVLSVPFPEEASHRFLRTIKLRVQHVLDIKEKSKKRVVKQVDINESNTKLDPPFDFDKSVQQFRGEAPYQR